MQRTYKSRGGDKRREGEKEDEASWTLQMGEGGGEGKKKRLTGDRDDESLSLITKFSRLGTRCTCDFSILPPLPATYNLAVSPFHSADGDG